MTAVIPILTNELLSTKLTTLVFVAYIFFGMCHGLLITASKTPTNGYNYNTITVIVLVNMVKLFASGALFVKDYVTNDPVLTSLIIPPTTTSKPQLLLSTTRELKTTLETSSCSTRISVSAEGVLLLFKELSKHRILILYFLVPSVLYTTYDNLMFVSLSVFSPTTYTILAQCRIVITAVIFERLFHRPLSGKQWLSLILLTLGCVVKELYHYTTNYTQHLGAHAPEDGDVDDVSSGPLPPTTSEYLMALGCVGVQIVCSCFATVYTEYLFKDKDCRAHPMVENVFMYSDNMMCSFVILSCRGQLWSVFTYSSLSSILTIPVVAIVVNQALLGLITATFLRKLNSIVKSFATAIELVLTPFVCWYLFGQRVDVCTVFALCVVSGASCIYASCPVEGDKTSADIIKEKHEANSNS